MRVEHSGPEELDRIIDIAITRIRRILRQELQRS